MLRDELDDVFWLRVSATDDTRDSIFHFPASCGGKSRQDDFTITDMTERKRLELVDHQKNLKPCAVLATTLFQISTMARWSF
jgi:hypothetical protein